MDLLEEESIPIKKCVKEGKIKLLNLPIITEDNEEDFLKAYDVLDDYDEALNTLGYYESINIWADESEYILSPFEETTGYIVGEYTVENFREDFSMLPRYRYMQILLSKELLWVSQMKFCPITRNVHLRVNIFGRIRMPVI